MRGFLRESSTGRTYKIYVTKSCEKHVSRSVFHEKFENLLRGSRKNFWTKCRTRKVLMIYWRGSDESTLKNRYALHFHRFFTNFFLFCCKLLEKLWCFFGIRDWRILLFITLLEWTLVIKHLNQKIALSFFDML